MKITRCDICVTEECRSKGALPGSCDCSHCKNIKMCPKILRPVIRITTKCTQECSHCCYSCSPERTDMMSIKTAKKINEFLIANKIENITIMGGEFICNPVWKEIFDILIPDKNYVRIVSNGDWATKKSVSKFLKKFDNIKISLSKDRWHTNKNVDKAEKLCIDDNINYNVALEKEVSEESIVPVGRGVCSYGTYSMFNTYCSNPEKKYVFMIDEQGEIYKCSFGLWAWTNIKEHLDGSFRALFKEVGMNHEKIFITNCATCNRAHERREDYEK